MMTTGRWIYLRPCDLGSVYRNSRTGREHVRPGGYLTRYPFSDEVVRTLWRRQTATGESFIDYLGTVLQNPEDAERVTFCDDCGVPGGETFSAVNDDDLVCDDCSANYYCCDDCDRMYDSTTPTLHATEVCDRCLRNGSWSWCDECEGYYLEECPGEHDSGCPCQAPHQAFSVRNDGAPALANDTRTTVALPAGLISAEGVQSIWRYLHDASFREEEDSDTRLKLYQLSTTVTELDATVQTPQGNYAKRLSRLAYQRFGLKLTPDQLSQVGNLAAQHSQGAAYDVEVTRDLNLPAADFVHEDSCWWQSYASSRCALKQSGGFGLRAFNGPTPVGRAWVLPLALDENGDLSPTHDTTTPAAFVVFNGYGTLSGYAPARLVAHMAGLTYRKVGFYCDPMFVNGNTGYLVAPEDIAKRYTDGSLTLESVTCS